MGNRIFTQPVAHMDDEDWEEIIAALQPCSDSVVDIAICLRSRNNAPTWGYTLSVSGKVEAEKINATLARKGVRFRLYNPNTIHRNADYRHYNAGDRDWCFGQSGAVKHE